MLSVWTAIAQLCKCQMVVTLLLFWISNVMFIGFRFRTKLSYFAKPLGGLTNQPHIMFHKLVVSDGGLLLICFDF